MLSVFSIDESIKWNEIVKNFKNYDVYYLPNYSKAFKIHGDGEPTLFYYKDREIRGMNVVMKRDIAEDNNFNGKIPLKTYFDLITPYGYGGFLIEGNKSENALKRINHAYEKYCIDNGIISEFARFHPILNNHKGLESFYDVINLGKTVSIDLKSSEYIWNNLTSKNRNVVRKAIKNGIEIYWGRSEELFNKFIEMYTITMNRDNAKDYYYFKEDFFYSILKDLKYNSLIFYAEYNKKIVAMSMILLSNYQMHCHLAASYKEYLIYAPTNLLKYEIACWGVNNGFKNFHLGGGVGSKEDSLYKYKKSFNRNFDHSYYVGRKIFDEEKYDRLSKICKGEKFLENENSFFPSYRG